MTLTVTCPQCGHARQTPREKIPPRPVDATCPRCKATFPFTGHLEPAKPTATARPAPPPPPAAATAPLAAVAPPASPPLQAAPAAPKPPKRTTRRFVFTGQTGEYFGIWIVNLLLKIVTFGLYSAWAKVRKRRYFYGNTLLDGAPFDYTADPMAIFRGWCLGAGAFVIYSIGSQVSPILGMIFGLLIFVAVPWVIVRSRIFHARNSTHRNIRFTFRPNYREAYVIYAGLPLLTFFTLGLIIPYIVYRQKKFQVENSGFGQTSFSFVAKVGDFYRLFFKAGLVLLLIVAILGGATAMVAPSMPIGNPAALAALMPVVIFAFLAFYFFMAVYVQTELTNLSWNATRLGEAQLASTLRTRDMAWLYFSSALAIFCSFGLLIPWAAVRLARYRFEHLAISVVGELRTLAAEQAEVSAAGEELGDIFGIEVGLG